MPLRIALPKGRLLSGTSTLLEKAYWGLTDYHETTRFYRFNSPRFPDLLAKVFHERDIPIQVAVGNYDLGICGLDWVEELLVKYPSSTLVKVKDLGYGRGILYVAASRWKKAHTIRQMQSLLEVIRIVSEYPNLAESFAVKNRLRRFSIFPLWGAADVYPPESADLVLMPTRKPGDVSSLGLIPVSSVLPFSAFLIANKDSWETKNLSDVLTSIGDNLLPNQSFPFAPDIDTMLGIARQPPSPSTNKETIWLALPDGHQQQAILELLKKADIQVDDYPSSKGNRRPTINLESVRIKVIRPQDMPLQVANGNFDLAVTGKDCLIEHLYQFPSSPVTELLDLKSGKVRLVAVVSNELTISDVPGLRKIAAGRTVPLRVASEYVSIADKYARDNHLGPYRIIPTWGATEAFLPEDADLLIEVTQTGRTIAEHNLKIVDTLFESTACLIGNSASLVNPAKSGGIKSIVGKLCQAVEAS